MYRSAAAFIWSSRRRRSRCWRFQVVVRGFALLRVRGGDADEEFGTVLGLEREVLDGGNIVLALDALDRRDFAVLEAVEREADSVAGGDLQGHGLADARVDLDDVAGIAIADEVVVFNSTDRDVDVSFADEETVDDKLALRDDGAFMPE